MKKNTKKNCSILKTIVRWMKRGVLLGIPLYLIFKNKDDKGKPTQTDTDFTDENHLIILPESQIDSRFLQIENTINLRDIGGYTTTDGKTTKWGKVYRSEELAHLPEKSIADLEKLGIRNIYDFRDDHKLVKHPDPEIEGATNHHVPVLKDISHSAKDIDLNDPNGIDTFMKNVYDYLVKERAQDFADILKIITDEKQLPILIHCTNGKDRTGFMIALILLICRVPEETVYSDYTLSNYTFDEAFDTLGTILHDEINAVTEIKKSALRDFFGVKPDWLKITLDYINKQYGNVETYLLSHTDMTLDDFDKIRKNLTE
ncbi:MAG: tyrosine-protein phosphatase [Eubacteriaceae bacterium]|jgi:protein-tyrosine phosphatase|nr:tyrosine-protein phosphatase [Eubacteriaceae bacterium]